MQVAQVLAQELNVPESSGGGEWVVWVLLAVGIVALYLMIKNTKKKAYQDYWDRRKAEEQRRLDDPDMAPPPSPED